MESGHQGLLSSDFYLGWFSKWPKQEQAFDHVHQIGQLLPVSIYKLVVEGTVEECMIKVSSCLLNPPY